MIWVVLALLAAPVGAVSGWVFPRWWSIIAGALVPWLGMLAWILYPEYALPYQGGGVSMWPVAQLFAGTYVAVVGGVSAATVSWFRRRNRSQ